MEKIGVILFGYGNTGKLLAREVLRHDGELLAIVDRDPRLLGQEVHGVVITADAEKALAKARAEVALISVGGDFAYVEAVAMQCLLKGINVITTCEEAIFPYSTSPDTVARLDAAAKKYGCSMTASGFQDCFWLNAVTTFASSCGRIDRIRGRLRYNIDEYGGSLALDHGVGLDINAFQEKFCRSFVPSYLWNANELLAAKLGWGVKSQEQKCVPYVHHENLYSAALGKTVEKGSCIGMSALVTTETLFGGIIETECIGKIYAAGDKDLCSWSFTGEPSLSFEVKSPQTLRHTAASVVNRIPQIINAAPGYVTIDRLGENEYLTFPLTLYKNKD